MPRRSYKPEEIVAKLRQVDVLTSQGRSVAEAIRSIGVSEVTYYRWRQEFGGLKSGQIKRLKELETENTRLRRAVSDLTLDKLILQEAARGNYFSIRGSSVNSRLTSTSIAVLGGPVELLLLSEIGQTPSHDGIRRRRRSHLSRALRAAWRSSFHGLTHSHRPHRDLLRRGGAR